MKTSTSDCASHPAPVQDSSKRIDPVSGGVTRSVPEAGFSPVHPPEAKQESAFVDDQDRSNPRVISASSTDALKVSVGAAGGGGGDGV